MFFSGGGGELMALPANAISITNIFATAVVRGTVGYPILCFLVWAQKKAA